MIRPTSRFFKLYAAWLLRVYTSFNTASQGFLLLHNPPLYMALEALYYTNFTIMNLMEPLNSHASCGCDRTAAGSRGQFLAIPLH